MECGGKSAGGGRDAALDSRIEKRAARNGMTGIKELRTTIQSAPTRRGALHGPIASLEIRFFSDMLDVRADQ
ncbi:MAG: hypothetical protein PHX83_02080 [Acidobacteriia bacterium]|nr:hypothetical protein [Terriglobia bacterium]